MRAEVSTTERKESQNNGFPAHTFPTGKTLKGQKSAKWWQSSYTFDRSTNWYNHFAKKFVYMYTFKLALLLLSKYSRATATQYSWIYFSQIQPEKHWKKTLSRKHHEEHSMNDRMP